MFTYSEMVNMTFIITINVEYVLPMKRLICPLPITMNTECFHTVKLLYANYH